MSLVAIATLSSLRSEQYKLNYEKGRIDYIMNKQVKMYCVKLGLVRNDEEKELGNKRNKLKQRKYKFRERYSNAIKKGLKTENWTEECSEIFKERIKNSKYYSQIEKDLRQVKKDIHDLYVKNKDLDRSVKSENIRTKDIIAIGDNNLVRTLGLGLGTFTDKIITVKVGDMDDLIIKKIIKDGLKVDDKSYIFFTAGAGQTRQKKFMMILKDVWDICEKALMCGLSIKELNKKGSLNISKFLAYLSLNNSGSTIWGDGFDIDKCIVVDDFETMVSATVDYISRETNKVEKTIEFERNGKKVTQKRKSDVAEWNIIKGKTMDVPVPHFDGLGIMLPTLSKKNIQVRCPWIKGLLTPFNFTKYIEEKGYSTKVTDIYDNEWDLIEDDVQIIFTKSQFKLWSFYKDWEDYKNNFKEYNCTANICMQDEDEYKDMDINYQMLQQLVNMSDKQIEILCKDFKELIKKVHSDRKSQLEFLKATNKNEHRNNFQEALRIYPEMLTSAYVKDKISKTITKAKKEACSGKIRIKNSRRVFILSDPTAFADWLFGGIEVPEGYLKDNEVYCNLYKKETKLDILRSPSLSFEHVIRTNVRATKGEYKWFNTNGIYTSTHDVISKVLNFDVDGDEALILVTDWIIALAEEMIKKYDIHPIYFEMDKAGAKEINGDNIVESLLFVYHKANIGKVSNTLTRIWNNENPMQYYDIMQKLCAHNNDVIDSAKTLSIKKLPSDIKEIIKNDKYPYFFQYAKNKKELQCKQISNSVMDRLCKSIENIKNTKFDYSQGFGAFRMKTLMFNQYNIDINKDAITKYLELEEDTTDKIDEYAREFENEDEEDMKKTDFKGMFYETARKDFEQWAENNNIEILDVIDSIIKYTYKTNSLHMAFLWNVFGQEIINNININIKKPLDDGYMICEDCGKRVKREANNQLRCKKCASKKSHKKLERDSEKSSKMA